MYSHAMETRGNKREALTRTLPAPLDRIQLSVRGDCPLVGFGGEEDSGAMDRWGEATITVDPNEEDDEPDDGWWNQEGATLDKTVAGTALKLTILRACGLLVDLSRVKNVYNALDARSADYEVFSSMFDGPGNPELVEELQEGLLRPGDRAGGSCLACARMARARRRWPPADRATAALGLPGAEGCRPHAVPDRPGRRAAGGRGRL